MIEELARALNGRRWPDHVHQQLGARVGDAVVPSLRPVIGAAFDGTAFDGTGLSKVGGLPRVDGSFIWPVEEGTDEPLALVCQLNLEEAGEGLRGMLYLFSIFDSDRAYGYEIDTSTAVLLHVPSPGPLNVAARPQGLADDGVFPERALRLGPSLFTSERFDYEVEKAVEEEIIALGGVPCDVIRLLGAPDPFREETREIVEEFQDPRLLLYVNGYAVQRHAFGEGDFLIVIEHDDLEAGRLGAAEVLFEPGT